MKSTAKITGAVALALLLGVGTVAPVALSPQDVSGSNMPPAENSLSLPSNEVDDVTGLPSYPLQWCIVETPGSVSDKCDIVSPSEVNKIAVCPDGTTVWAVDIPSKTIRKSTEYGWRWNETPNTTLHGKMTEFGVPADNQVIWDIATAPDDSNFVAVVTGSAISPNPTEVWVSQNGGADWDCTSFAVVFSTDTIIGAIDISMDYGGSRDIAVGIRNGGSAVNANLEIWVIKSTGFNSWKLQSVMPVEATNPCDVQALEFSPTYAADTTLVIVFTDATATYFNVALRNLDHAVNDIVAWVYNPSVEVKSLASPALASPGTAAVVTADLELPSDFSGQAASLRRTYISIDAGASKATGTNEDGIYRIDDTDVYDLMNTTDASDKRISSLAYHGTCAAGKLLAGEVRGYPCTAMVETWFTDAPTSYPIPCWYPSLKPPTGAANQGNCTAGSKDGFGNGQVAWSPNGMVAYCGTSSAPLTDSAAWPDAYLVGQALDESAFSFSRCNGETWNQPGLIDTAIDKLTDVVPSADSSTAYLASVNTNSGCSGFDSVWRSSTNPTVIAPLPVESMGTIWQRVLCRVTAPTCEQQQTDMAILRLAPDNTDGQIVFWAAQDPAGSLANGVAAWSPDYGDFWASILPRNPVQDLAAESCMHLYVLSPDGLVQHMSFTGTAWSTTLPDVDTSLGSGFSIAALVDGHVLVGAGDSSDYPVAYSNDYAASFMSMPEMMTTSPSNICVAFDASFTSNGFIYAATDNQLNPGSIYRNTVPAYTQWNDLHPLSAGYHGMAVNTQGTLYAANALFAERTLIPDVSPIESGAWDALLAGLDGFPVRFTLQPNCLKLSGSLSSATDIQLWAIDDTDYLSPTANSGRLWRYEDELPPTPPYDTLQLLAPNNGAINCPVSPVAFSWSPFQETTKYKFVLARDAAMTQVVVETEVTTTAYDYPGTLDYATNYFWHVMALEPAPSDWSATFSFTTEPPAGTVYVSINLTDTTFSDMVAPCTDFIAAVEIGPVTDFNGAQYDVCFNPLVLRLDNITPGQIDGTAIPIEGFTEIAPGTYRVLQSMGLGSVSGAGYLAELHFRAIGAWGDSSNIDLINGILSGMGGGITATWTGHGVTVLALPGDANCDGQINVLDMTKVARIILGLDIPAPCGYLSFVPAVYVNSEYGFSVKYPNDWVERPELEDADTPFAAGIPAFVPDMTVTISPADGLSWSQSLTAGLEADGCTNVQVISQAETTLCGGAPATEGRVTYITQTGYEANSFWLGAQKGGNWIKIQVFTIDAFSPYDEALFSEIAHTLEL